MTAETWEIKKITIEPFSGTKIFCQNEDNDKWVFVRSYYHNTLYVRLWCNSQIDYKIEIAKYGIGGFNIPDEYQHKQIQIGISANNEDWHWVVHNYSNGWTS